MTTPNTLLWPAVAGGGGGTNPAGSSLTTENSSIKVTVPDSSVVPTDAQSIKVNSPDAITVPDDLSQFKFNAIDSIATQSESLGPFKVQVPDSILLPTEASTFNLNARSADETINNSRGVTIIDSGPNGYHGKLNGRVLPTVAASPFGSYGNAITFDGVNRGSSSMYFDCGISPSVTDIFTIEAKIRTGAVVTGAGIFAGKYKTGNIAGAAQPIIYYNASKFYVLVRDGAGVTKSCVSTTSIAANTNYSIAGSYDGASLRLFINGTLEATTAMTSVEPSDLTTRFLIGADDDTAQTTNGGLPFPGTIDEVRLSKIARYTATYTPSATQFTSDSNTVGLWHMDSLVGSLIQTTDSSSNGYHGVLVGDIAPTLVNAPWGAAFNQSQYFDGKNRNIVSMCWDCGTAPAMSTNASCLEARVKTGPSIVLGSAYVIASRFSSTTSTGAANCIIYVGNNVSGTASVFVALVTDSANVLKAIYGTTSPSVNTNYSVALSYDGTTLRLFVNGVLDGSIACSAIQIPDTTTRFLIGKDDDSNSPVNGGYPWLGTIGEVRLSNTARYTANYTPATTPFVNDVSTVGLWHLDDISNLGVESYSAVIDGGSDLPSNPTSSGYMEVFYQTAGAGSWLCPTGVTSIDIWLTGAGGTAGAGGAVGPGGGGQGGGTSLVSGFAVTPGNTYNFNVGAGGSPGGNTTFAGTAIVGGGGQQGFAGSATAGSGGSAAGAGNVGNGGNGVTSGVGVTTGGGGGGGAGIAGNGSPGGGSGGGAGGPGFTPGGGAGGAGGSGGAGNGNAGSVPGGGGAGGGASATAPGAGGAGATGRVVIRWATA